MTNSTEHPGTVYLVGAGPGHPGLITRWGYDLLQQCDAVAYDALIPMELISGLPEGVEKHYVGKRAGRHSLPQSEINELLVTLSRRGLNVVRLKGGDPFVFGRIGEEAEYLSAAGIPLVMIPGVTAASAAAAMSGFSLTSRQESSWIFIATGHPAEDSSTPVPWDQVAALPGGTLVIYMGISRLDSIVEQLLASGMAPETPAVVVQAASTGLQRSVQAPINKISRECRRHQLKPPALVVIGESIRSRTGNIRIENLSLSGRKVLLTGPSWSTGNISASLREAGAQPIPYPTSACTRFDDDAGWKQFRENIHSGGLCLFQREIEVHHFFDEIMQRGLDIRDLAHFRMIASGKSTETAMLSHGIRADHTLQDLEPPSLKKCLSILAPDSSLPLIWIGTKPEEFISKDGIQQQYSTVIPLTVVLELTAEWDPRWKDGLSEEPPDFIVFTGTSEVKGFLELMGIDAASKLTRQSSVVATDASIANTLHQYSLPCTIKLNTPNPENLIQALAEQALAEHS